MLSYALIVSQVDFFIARNWCYLVCITVVLCTKKPAHYALVWVITTGLLLAFLT
jgi:hypothetical protein